MTLKFEWNLQQEASVDWNVLLRECKELGWRVTEQEASATCRFLDKNKDGNIDLSELRRGVAEARLFVAHVENASSSVCWAGAPASPIIRSPDSRRSFPVLQAKLIPAEVRYVKCQNGQHKLEKLLQDAGGLRKT